MERFFDYRITFNIPTLFMAAMIVFVAGLFVGFYHGFKAGRKLDSTHFDFDNKTNLPNYIKNDLGTGDSKQDKK